MADEKPADQVDVNGALARAAAKAQQDAKRAGEKADQAKTTADSAKQIAERANPQIAGVVRGDGSTAFRDGRDPSAKTWEVANDGSIKRT